MGDDRAKAGTRAALRSARSHLRSVIGKQVRLKYLPELEFEEDTTYEQGRRIDELIAGLQPAEDDR
jgi:ribosome-binding factor A